MDLREIGWGVMDWIDLAKDRGSSRALLNTVMNLRIPQTFGKFLSSCATGGFCRRVSSVKLVSALLNVNEYIGGTYLLHF
jgi:hypothetical protein